MTFAATLITCPIRDDLCEQTLASLAKSDWGVKPEIFRDEESGSSERTRQYTLRALNWFFSATHADYCLFLEDDVLFNVHLRWNLEHWTPLVDRTLWIGTLYTPRQENDGFRWASAGKDYISAQGPQYGAQAIILSRHAVALIIRDWAVSGIPEHPADRCPSDFKMMLPIIWAGHPVYYHVPSLVQHVGQQATWISEPRFHEAWNFEPEWKAE